MIRIIPGIIPIIRRTIAIILGMMAIIPGMMAIILGIIAIIPRTIAIIPRIIPNIRGPRMSQISLSAPIYGTFVRFTRKMSSDGLTFDRFFGV